MVIKPYGIIADYFPKDVIQLPFLVTILGPFFLCTLLFSLLNCNFLIFLYSVRERLLSNIFISIMVLRFYIKMTKKNI